MRELTAYLVTLRAYGTWLHGDERGSVNGKNNGYLEPVIEPNRGYASAMKRAMASEPIWFDAEQRRCIEQTFLEVASYRNWVLAALAVRTNHLHAVVGADVPPEKVVIDFKAYVTRRLREANLVNKNQIVWAEHGSTLYLFDAQSYERAVDYVLNQQGEDL